MRIINPAVLDHIAAGEPINLDLGAGLKGRQDCFTLDHKELPGVDIVADLNEPLDGLPDNCVGELYTRHTLEHIDRLLPLLAEMHRISRADGKIEITVPHFSNPYFYSDPTHVRFFGLYSMYYFVNPEDQPASRRVPPYYTETRFFLDNIWIDFYQRSLWDRIAAPLFSRVVNHSLGWQDFYERRLCPFFHAWQITYRMRPNKSAPEST